MWGFPAPGLVGVFFLHEEECGYIEGNNVTTRSNAIS